MKRSLAVAITIGAVVCLGGERSAHAQLSLADAMCRKSVGRGVRTFASTLLKEIGKCHRRRMLGRVAADINCNNAGDSGFPRAARVIRARARLITTVAKGCQATTTSPQDNGYNVCGDPCGTNIITGDYASVADCLACATMSNITRAADGAFGTPPIPGHSSAPEGCQTGIAASLRRYSLARMRAQQLCAFDRDRAPTGVDCKAVDAFSDVAAALANANQVVARTCQDPSITALHSCGTDVTSVQTCIQGLADAGSNSLFDRVYDPSSCTNDQPWPVVEPVISPTDLSEQTINICGRIDGSFTLQVSTSFGYIPVSSSSPGQCTLPCNISGAGCYAVTVPLRPGMTNYLSGCWANSACSTAGCTDVDGNGNRLAIVQNSTPAPESTRTYTRTPTPTATPTPTLTPTGQISTPTPNPTPLTPIPTGTPTPVASMATPPSPTPTYDPASCANDQPWPVVEPVISPTDLSEQTINICGRNTGSFTLRVSTSFGYIAVSPSSPGQCTLPCNISGAGCYAVTVPLRSGMTNYLSSCWANSACSTAGCTDVDGNGNRLAIVQSSTPPPQSTRTSTPTRTP